VHPEPAALDRELEPGAIFGRLDLVPIYKRVIDVARAAPARGSAEGTEACCANLIPQSSPPLQPFSQPLPGCPATARPDPSGETPPPGVIMFVGQRSIFGPLFDFCSLGSRFGELSIPFS
jgi:hypothetical protein